MAAGEVGLSVEFLWTNGSDGWLPEVFGDAIEDREFDATRLITFAEKMYVPGFESGHLL